MEEAAHTIVELNQSGFAPTKEASELEEKSNTIGNVALATKSGRFSTTKVEEPPLENPQNMNGTMDEMNPQVTFEIPSDDSDEDSDYMSAQEEERADDHVLEEDLLAEDIQIGQPAPEHPGENQFEDENAHQGA